MDQVSGFFSAPSSDDFSKISNPELIYSPEDGFIQLWRAGRGGRIRAYKALKQQFRGDPLYEGLLRKEFEIGYSLNHPNICEYLSFCSEEPFGNCIEMEWVDGDELGRYVEAGSCANPYHVLDQICDALSYLHSKQVVHRDLKPSNILIAHSGGIVKLIDFGFADTGYHYALKQPAGTRVYAAPELVAGEKVDCRADIWSLGCIIAMMLPHKRRVARKCMQRNPARRYSSASQVKAALHSRFLPVWVWAALGVILAACLAMFIIGPGAGMRRESPAAAADSAGHYDMPAANFAVHQDMPEADSVRVPDPVDVGGQVQSATPPGPSVRSRKSSAAAAAAPSDPVPSASVEALFEKATRLIEDAGK